MKTKFALLIFMYFFLLDLSHSQKIIGYNYNVDIYRPFTIQGQTFLENTGKKVDSKTFSIFYNYSFLINEKQGFTLGMSFKKTKFEVDNIIEKIEYLIEDNFENVIDTGIFLSTMDLRYSSMSGGLNLEWFYVKTWNKLSISYFGLASSMYLFEYTEEDYYGSKDYRPDIPPGIYFGKYIFPDNGELGYRKGFFLSSINLSTYYRHVFQLHEKFSLAARVSIGTNLYSDWDQFKKYAWLGLGLEMGFGKTKTWKKEKTDQL